MSTTLYLILPVLSYTREIIVSRNLNSSVVSPKIIGASIKELTIASKCLYNTSPEDFIDRMKYIISISSIDREYADEYSLVFDNTLITRHYIEDRIALSVDSTLCSFIPDTS